MSQTTERTATLRTHRNANKIINQAVLARLPDRHFDDSSPTNAVAGCGCLVVIVGQDVWRGTFCRLWLGRVDGAR
jgi:hypothetical protein